MALRKLPLKVWLAAALSALAAPSWAGMEGSTDQLGDAQTNAREIIKSYPARNQVKAEFLFHFDFVSAGIYRAGEPDLGGLAQLKEMGMKTILSLTQYDEWEARETRRLGMDAENVPMSNQKPPSFAEMDQALAIIGQAPRPILVHCFWGDDRTGFVIAAYRVFVEGRDIDWAVKEATAHRCCHSAFGDLKAFLEAYRKHRLG